MGLRVELDSACAPLEALREKHRSQRALLLNDHAGPSRLRDIVQQRQENDLIDHKMGCARCLAYVPPCGSCGRSVHEGHTFFCPENKHRWRNLFRRGKRAAPAAPAPAPAKKRVPVQAPARPAQAPAAARTPARAPPAPRPAAPKAPPPPAPRPAAPKAPPAPAAKAPPRPPPTPPPKPRAPPKLDPCAVLGLDADAPWDAVKAAYRQKAQQYHPDKVAGLADEFREIAEKRMREINEAYDALRKKHGAA